MDDMRSVPGSGGNRTAGDPWAGFGVRQYGSPHGFRAANGGGDPAGDDRDVADLARRLLDRLDGQESLLRQAADLAARPDDRARVGELHDAARRMRRDGEALLLLSGAEPGARGGAPRPVPAVLGDALALADDPSRAGLRSAPPVSVVAPAAAELRLLVAQLVDEVAAASPDARVEVGARVEPDDSLAVEVVAAGRGWPDARGGPRSAAGAPGLADRLARRSPGGFRLERRDGVDGPVVTLRCPAALVVGAPADPWARSGRPDPLVDPLVDPLPDLGPDPLSFDGPDPLGSGSFAPPFPSPSLPSPSLPSRPLAAVRSPEPFSLPRREESAPDTSLLVVAGAGRARGGDELFGPLPATVDTASTPIFEAVASAWFRDDEHGPAAEEWSSPGDREWRAAAAVATRTEVPTTTSTGLPRRSPGDRLVPPPREARPAAPDERVPERVRDRLATYQRGLRQGRHRATDAGAAVEPEAWSSEGW